MRGIGLLLAAPLLGLACARPASPPASASTDVAAVRQAIESANAQFFDALKRGDTVAARANYAEDAVVMMPNEGAWRGQPAVAKGFAGFLAQAAVTEGGTTTQDVMVSGDMAVETGSFEWTLSPKNGKPIKDKGKYVTVWRRQADGSWKIVRDINNSDLPATM